VGIAKLDRLLNLSGELAIARGRMRQVLETGQGGDLKHALEVHREADLLYADLQELVMQLRMVSVGPMFHRFTRIVRDQAATHGKQARLVIEGEDVEVDMKIIEHIHDPLTHMVRNALDHGIEPPDSRRAQGKDPCGTITLTARHETGNVVFEVSDDGAGLSREAVLARAREHGLLATGAETLSDAQVHQLILEPGFSTAATVTDLSGRGVGLDVVQRHIDALRGELTINSTEGSGTTMTARLPLTLAIIPGFGVGAGGETYLVPLESVVETLQLPPDHGAESNGRGVINVRGEPLPYIRLSHLFGLPDEAGLREQVLVVRHEEGRAGLVVDELHGESQTVIKPLGKLFQGLSGVAGSAILGDGRVALILDVPALLREATVETDPRRTTSESDESTSRAE
jgi:two-component system chemotaxis sensor kinase CheA